MKFYPGFDIQTINKPLGFVYGKGVFGPKVENRRLEDIRNHLMDPLCDGPDIVYSIAMDVGNIEDKEKIKQRNLLFGAVTYAKGTLGREPVRSQGHIHAISPSCMSSTCEVYEIWSGEAYIYMQESVQKNPGRCFAVYGKPGDIIIVPPGWAHCTIVADIEQNLSFGAWCVRDYGFDYSDIRAQGGLAWFPIIQNNKITFIQNDNYKFSNIIIKNLREYKELGIRNDIPIYQQFIDNPDLFLFVSNPQLINHIWENFIP